MLENVCGLLTNHPETLQWVLKELKAIGGKAYEIDAKVVNCNEHGLPQSRKRLWIVGRLKTKIVTQFQWPEPYGCVPLAPILDKLVGTVGPQHAPPASQGTAQANLVKAFSEIGSLTKKNPCLVDAIVDIDGTKLHWMLDMSPCLTRHRCGIGGHWVTSRGRRLSTGEQLRLMGFKRSIMKVDSVTDRQLRLMIGNSCAVPVLERILLRLLPSVGLANDSAMKRRWESHAQATRSVADLKA